MAVIVRGLGRTPASCRATCSYEFVAVARRKHQVPWDCVQATLAVLSEICVVEPLTVAVHRQAVTLAQRLGFGIYDATLPASALAAGCDRVYAEDLQHGQRIEGALVVLNPFA